MSACFAVLAAVGAVALIAGNQAAAAAAPVHRSSDAAAAARIELIPAVSAVSSIPSRSGFVTRSGHSLYLGGSLFRFAGADEYYLGLDDNLRDSAGNPTYPTHARIDSALNAAVATGATVVRSHTLGISVGCAVCLEPRAGVFQDQALASADYAIYRAGQLGLHLIIPLTDQWRFYHGGESVFTGWAGYRNNPTSSVTAATNAVQRTAESNFYTSPSVIGMFRTYVAHLLDHVNPYNSLAYRNDPTIMAWETGNEIWTANPSWTQSLASYIKHTLGARQLVADGSAADGMTVADAAVDAPDVDIVGGHFYPVDIGWMKNDAAIAAAHGKAYVVGEFDWTNASATAAMVSAVQADPNISGDLYWTMMPHLENGTPEPHGDGFAMYSPATTSSAAGILAVLTAHARAMSAAR